MALPIEVFCLEAEEFFGERAEGEGGAVVSNFDAVDGIEVGVFEHDVGRGPVLEVGGAIGGEDDVAGNDAVVVADDGFDIVGVFDDIGPVIGGGLSNCHEFGAAVDSVVLRWLAGDIPVRFVDQSDGEGGQGSGEQSEEDQEDGAVEHGWLLGICFRGGALEKVVGGSRRGEKGGGDEGRKEVFPCFGRAVSRCEIAGAGALPEGWPQSILG